MNERKKKTVKRLWRGSQRALNRPLKRAIFSKGNGGEIFLTDDDRTSLLLLSSSVRTTGRYLTFTSSPAHWNPPISQHSPPSISVLRSQLRSYTRYSECFFLRFWGCRENKRKMHFFPPQDGRPSSIVYFVPQRERVVGAESALSQKPRGSDLQESHCSFRRQGWRSSGGVRWRGETATSRTASSG